MPAHSSLSFARGAPSLDLIDIEGLQESAVAAFSRDPGGTTAYGTAEGYGPLRDWIAEQHQVDPQCVMVTNGSLQAASLLFDELGSNTSVVVEDPTYDRTLTGLKHRGAKVRAVPLENDGLSITALARLLKQEDSPALAHVIPTFHNPAGCTLSLVKRRELLRLAQQYGFVVFEDDPYLHLRFRGDAVPTMASLDSSDSVVYASSFSKTVCPGIRVGYLMGPASLISILTARATETYLSPSMVSQSIVYEFCSSGRLVRSIERVRVALSRRLDAMCDALGNLIPDATYVAPDGGYFLWVVLPPDVAAEGLPNAAKKDGVTFVRGTDFTVERSLNAIRLAFSAVGPDGIREGIRRLALAIDDLRD